MSRKTGKDAKVEVEVGNRYYAMSALSTVASPAADVGKVFTTLATFLSDRENLQPTIIMDGVESGLTLSPGTANNSVDYSEGTVKIKGSTITVAEGTITDLLRPTTSGQVKVSALTVDSNGDVNVTEGLEGETSNTRGAAGAVPYLPIDEVLMGYITMTYYGGTASGASVVAAGDINDESRERSTIPSFTIVYHDGSGDNPTNVGVIKLGNALPLIHAENPNVAVGTNRRNVYASSYEAEFEEIPESMDYSFDEDIADIKSKAYGESSEEAALSTPSWNASGTSYWNKTNDLLTLIKNSKRWVKFFPDKDNTEYWAGRAIIKVSREMPVEDSLTASVSMTGSGELYQRDS